MEWGVTGNGYGGWAGRGGMGQLMRSLWVDKNVLILGGGDAV